MVANADATVLKHAFAKNLQAAMIRKGWNQSELARRASERLPRPAPGQKRGKAIGRDLISHYIRGLMLPGPANLEAIAEALGVKSGDLMPAAGHLEQTPFEMRGTQDGRMYLRIARTVNQETAMKIMAILAEEDRG